MKAPIEVYEATPGADRETKVALFLLDGDAPVPAVGDVLLHGDLGTSGILLGGAISAFRVVEREFLFSKVPSKDEKPSPFSKVWIHVRRMTREEYFATPGG